jgi:hypothetical protein
MKCNHVSDVRRSANVLQRVLAFGVAAFAKRNEYLVGLVNVRVEPLSYSRVRKISAKLQKVAANRVAPELFLLGTRLKTLDFWYGATYSSRIPT